MPALADLGDRICLIGPSNSGKSTLAEKLAVKIGTAIVHLDQLAHIPNTNWKRRPDEDFITDHDAAIRDDRWVIEGNYGVCMPQRFRRATSVIWLDPPLAGCMYRYIKRSLRRNSQRSGMLQGATGEFNLSLIKYTLFNYPKNRLKYATFLEDFSHPVLHLHSMQELNLCCREWDLDMSGPHRRYQLP